MKCFLLTSLVPLVFLITGCGASQDTINSATSTPDLKSVTQPAVLEGFPLEVGVTWVYSVSLAWGTLDQNGKYELVSESGVVTETITSKQPQGQALIFKATYQQSLPTKLSDDELDTEYKVIGNSVFVRKREMLRWPLVVGQEWSPWTPSIEGASPGTYVWRVVKQDVVTTLAGVFNNCYQLAIWTQPDHETRWFCPGIGIVWKEYTHGGMVYFQHWELQSINKP